MLVGIIHVMGMSEGTYHGWEGEVAEILVGVQEPSCPFGFSPFTLSSSVMARSD